MKITIGLSSIIFATSVNAELVIPVKYYDSNKGYIVKQTEQRFSQENSFVVEMTYIGGTDKKGEIWHTKCGYETNYSTGFEEIVCDTIQKNLLILTHSDFQKSLIFMDAFEGVNKFKTKVNIKIDSDNVIKDLRADLLPNNQTDIILRKLKSGKELIYTWKKSNGRFEKVKINLIGLKESLEFVDALKLENKSY